jgi:hypothetical protein
MDANEQKGPFNFMHDTWNNSSLEIGRWNLTECLWNDTQVNPSGLT